jgi:hypothetical protein
LNGLELDEAECPADVVDRLLWRNARRILDRHVLRFDGTCLWCERQGPCPPRRLAQRADAASRRPRHDAWTARNEISRLLPAAEMDFVAFAPSPRGHNERPFV